MACLIYGVINFNMHVANTIIMIGNVNAIICTSYDATTFTLSSVTAGRVAIAL